MEQSENTPTFEEVTIEELQARYERKHALDAIKGFGANTPGGHFGLALLFFGTGRFTIIDTEMGVRYRIPDWSDFSEQAIAKAELDARLTAEQIIDETVAFYGADNSLRAADGSGCQYATYDGRRCAVGRCIRPDAVLHYALSDGTMTAQPLLQAATGANEIVNMEEVLTMQYRGHPTEFWCDLQKLHDDAQYWTDGGLTSEGQRYVEELKEKWTQS